jgi:4-amino-4-deoxy-L-arabinose transferase-like glycosyltransferase
VRNLVRSNLRFFVIVSLAALGLRLLFILRFPAVVTDSFIYGDIAKNWLQHGVYGLSGAGPGEISPTYIRLPGYPAFLTLIFSLFGVDHYRAALIVQMLVDLGTCFICADIARRLLGPQFGRLAFGSAALCAFLANYSAAALTETFEVFFTALALNLAIAALHSHRTSRWVGCGAACGAAILLRPDGALVVVAIETYVLTELIRKQHRGFRQLRLQAALLLPAIAVLPLAPWTLRNWRLFHRFQPLAPRYANEENEFVPMGFNRWTKSWIADYVSVEEIYWAVPASKIDPAMLPSRAFDSAQEEQETYQVIADYNDLLHVSPALDARFEAIAVQRIQTHPFRYYVGLPVLRIFDMWLRPRTEMLPCDSRWWEFNDEPKWSALALALGAINLAYVVCAVVGWMKFRSVPLTGLLVLFVIFRSVFLGTLENPEPRYTLEMYPIVIVFAAAAANPRKETIVVANRSCESAYARARKGTRWHVGS